MIESIVVLALVAAIMSATAIVLFAGLRRRLDILHLSVVSESRSNSQQIEALHASYSRHGEQLVLLDKSKANARRPRVRNVKLTETVPLGVPK
jgi:hypothetical protein